MSDWTFDRAAAMGGIGFVVLAGGFAFAGLWMAATGIHTAVRPARPALVATQTA